MLNRWGSHESPGASLSRWVRALELAGKSIPGCSLPGVLFSSELISSHHERGCLPVATWFLRETGEGSMSHHVQVQIQPIW